MAHICFFRLGASPLFIPSSKETFGGAEVRAFLFARGIARHTTHAVSFATQARHGLPLDTSDGINVLPMPRSSRGLAKLANSIRQRVSRGPIPYAPLGEIDAEIVACFGIHDPTPGVIAAAKTLGKKSILFLTSSEDVSELQMDQGPKGRRRETNRYFALMSADEVVAQTKFQQRKMEQNFGRDIRLIRNPIDTSIPLELTDLPREHVLWVGRADTDSKRADLCLKLAAACPEIPFRVVMNDCDSFVGRELTSSVPRNVTIEKHVRFEEIDRLYATATALINTSVSEGFPNAFLQAAKYGTPILSLEVDPDDILESAGCGQVAGDIENMAHLVREFHKRGTRIEAMARQARKYVVECHELAARINELEPLLGCRIGTDRIRIADKREHLPVPTI